MKKKNKLRMQIIYLKYKYINFYLSLCIILFEVRFIKTMKVANNFTLFLKKKISLERQIQQNKYIRSLDLQKMPQTQAFCHP